MNDQLRSLAGDQPLHISLAGLDLLNSPRWNKGTAFTNPERDTFRLHGLLPPHVGTLEEQIERRMQRLRTLRTPFGNF
jgi:malate dehydrogenase (oxaloacetate-decarboxylating)